MKMRMCVTRRDARHRKLTRVPSLIGSIPAARGAGCSSSGSRAPSPADIAQDGPSLHVSFALHRFDHTFTVILRTAYRYRIQPSLCASSEPPSFQHIYESEAHHGCQIGFRNSGRGAYEACFSRDSKPIFVALIVYAEAKPYTAYISKLCPHPGTIASHREPLPQRDRKAYRTCGYCGEASGE